MWKIKEFKNRDAFQKFWDEHKYKYQMEEVFINNGYGIEYKPLKKIL